MNVYRSLAFLFLLAGAAAGLGAQRNAVDLGPEFQKCGLTPLQQGPRNDCSLFAITALTELEVARSSPGGGVPLSQEFLVWAAHAASGTKAGDQAMFYEAVHGLNVYGICNSTLMPYARSRDSGRKPSPEALADANARSGCWKVHWIKRWDIKSGLSSVALTQVKRALAQGHAVACGLRWPKRLDGGEILRVPPAQDVFDGHSIAFTGYRDDAEKPGGGMLLFRNSFGPQWGAHGYGRMSYAYAEEYANDALWLQLGAPHSEKPRVRFEAEDLAVLAHGRCEWHRQSMNDWGKGMWSGGAQLVCSAKNGGFVELGFKVDQAGDYRMRVLATAAPDYGKIRVALDGRPVGRDFDLYSGRVSPSGSLELGNHRLAAGRHRLRVTAIGKHAASAGYYFGVDVIDLLDE
jgi:hypothetical protein